MDRKRLCGLTIDEIFGLIQPEGYTISHATKVANSIYRKSISDISLMNGISKDLKIIIGEKVDSGIYSPVSSEISSDGTIKYLFISPEGRKFESVWMADRKRKTVCVSVQSGCKMGCPFCVTGKYGFHGDLTAGDIVNQVLSSPHGDKPTHVVFMGMGEPMDNLENVLKACAILSAEWGLALSPGNITISSVGITPAIAEFLRRSSCNLAISLYSPFSDERREVVPAESVYPVSEIINMMRAFPVARKRRFSVAYVMIRGVNDSAEHLEGLKNLLAESGIRVNLLPYHRAGKDTRESSPDETIMRFKHGLVTSGISASIRKSRGADISAACGLLGGSE
ncbi:MAG: 23S rRNA (adenine(2503)-C(2))-methyltransferase RlmN [Bacteroidota bacterium]